MYQFDLYSQAFLRIWFAYGKNQRVIYHRTECRGCGLETCIVEKKRCLTSVGEVMACV